MSVSSPQAPAGSAQDDVLRAIHAHHAELETAVAAGAVAVRDAAERLVDVAPRRDALVRLLVDEVLPHALAEEGTLYDVGGVLPQTALLVNAMVGEHRRLEFLVDELSRARTSVAMAGFATAVRALFEAHLAKENDLLLPALVGADVDLARLLDGMHEILGAGAAAAEESHGGCGCGGCGCGGSQGSADAGEPAAVAADELDVRSMVPALRHERIFARVAGLTAGEAFVLVNDHDPLPLRYQLDAEQPGRIGWIYLDEGPQVWRVRISRLATAS